MKITVFTPTFNRGYTLGRLYQSLVNQTIKDFEWLIVDDGSVDDTEQIISAFQKSDNGFDIIYQKCQNGGKHRAINRGVKSARGELFFIVDSDDYLTNDSIENIIQWENGLDKNCKWAGVSGLKGYNESEIIGESFKGDFVDCTSAERAKFNIYGDKSECIYTEVLKKFPFMEFDGEKFITEDTVWLKIAQAGYKIRWWNKINYVAEYLQDGLSNNGMKLQIKNPKGVFYASNIYLKVYKNNKRKYFGAISTSYIIGKANGMSKKQVANELNVSVLKVQLSIILKKAFDFLKK